MTKVRTVRRFSTLYNALYSISWNDSHPPTSTYLYNEQI